METKSQYQMNQNQSWSVFQDHLTKATLEGKAAAADLCATRLDKLATHAVIEGLTAAEIVALLREEAAAICSKGGAAWQ